MDVARRDACRHEAPAHFMDRIVEDRLGIITGGEHHLPAPRGAGWAGPCCETVADNRTEDWHEAGNPDEGPQRHRAGPSEEHPQHGAASRAILTKIEEITRCQ
jgi:hypothetical protein